MKFKIGDMVIYQQFAYGFQVKGILDDDEYLIQDYDFGEFSEIKAKENELKSMDAEENKNIKKMVLSNDEYELRRYSWTELNGMECEVFLINSKRVIPTDFVKNHIEKIRRLNEQNI